jgi:hypothetical protein
VPVQQVQAYLCQVFACWGQPGALRVDNGEPFGSPTGYAPPALSLWLIGQGVKMIWNQPRCPKQNACVEKLQDTTSRWAEVNNCASLEQLQQRLDAHVQLQREHYPVSRLGGQTRLQAYPGLLSNQRPYQAEDFQVERVWAFFQTCVYTRRISASGVLTHFGVQTSVGAAYKGQWAQVRLSQEGLLWEVLVDYKVVKTYPASCLSKERLQSLTVYQRTNSGSQT